MMPSSIPFLTLHHPALAKAYYASGLWQEDTFYSLAKRHAIARPGELALQDGRSALTWAQLTARVDAAAQGMRALGLERGDRVALWMSNRIEAVIAFIACSREGFACNPSLHHTQARADVLRSLERLSARLLITEPGWGGEPPAAREDWRATLHAVKSLRAVWTPEEMPDGTADRTQAPIPDADPDGVCYMAFTSGTTGEPKAVMHSANTLLANARELVRDWGHDARTAILSLSPVSHHIAWVGVAQWLVCGGRFVTANGPTGMSKLDWIAASGATYVMGVPTHAMDVLAEQATSGTKLGNVSVFYMAGSPIPPVVARAFLEQGTTPQNVYGMTENSSHQYTHPDDGASLILSTCGRGGAAYEVRLFDVEDPDKPVAVGEIGQIGGRGAALMLGYFADQEATASSFNAGGWFMSGDLGRMDDDGNLSIEGRSKDVIIRGGHNIYPARIEALALRHGEAGRVACFPVKDERLGERVCIALSGPVDPLVLNQWMADEGLSRAELPEFFVRINDFPLSGSGKILKRELVNQARRREIVPQPLR
ncbi:cyclohexanecarboxylate-CoA ligase [soil metagenome]